MRQQQGFTLVEVLIISAVLMVAAVSINALFSSQARRSQDLHQSGHFQGMVADQVQRSVGSDSLNSTVTLGLAFNPPQLPSPSPTATRAPQATAGNFNTSDFLNGSELNSFIEICKPLGGAMDPSSCPLAWAGYSPGLYTVCIQNLFSSNSRFQCCMNQWNLTQSSALSAKAFCDSQELQGGN